MIKETSEELITSYVDGEIADDSQKGKIKSLIESNAELNFEYKVQSSLKKLISERLKPEPAPENIAKKLFNSINPSKRFSSFFLRILFWKR